MAEPPAVVVERPTIIKQFNLVDPGLTPQPVMQSIPVPYTMWEAVELFMPPGTNFSVRAAFGYNGKRLIPSETSTEYIMGAGYTHRYPVGIPVYGNVNVWFYQTNVFPHVVTVILYLNYRPIQDAARRQAMVTPA